MELEQLKQELNKIKNSNLSTEWFESLEERKKEEANFHDFSHHDGTELDNKKYYQTTLLSKAYIQNWFKKNVPNKVVLDYACGNGVTAVETALYGAKYVIGLDISAGSVANATRNAQTKGVSDKCFFFQGDCEKTGLPDSCIDVIICAGMLHHLDLSYAFPELRRILNPGGKIIAIEALNYNPLIRMYRLLTPEMRTEWEKHHILSLKDVTFGKYFFEIGEVKYWHVTSFVAAFFRRQPVIMKGFLIILNGLDQILSKIPFVQRMAWQFTFEFIGKEKE